MKNKKTLVIGASLNPNRYSYLAIQKLIANAIEVRALGRKKGEIFNVKINTFKKFFKDIHTITVYLNKKNQVEFYNYILEINPKRVIFNPGTENVELEKLLSKNMIPFERSCTLVLLGIGEY
ncbi:MAG: CoA-binding protein [Lutibacter sp.]|uniref:CoA-binding protein n=1 Tax=Lutibacter sp. TaxID=1925666 RepID=UPI00181EB306|nr:CoA-binding protein [Lutibacter sp.]MBT8316555.1 CoA-binding protein [Lutibacter sp.]NNJ57415.1 CoA-binding protein [Lutibacter sp.]